MTDRREFIKTSLFAAASLAVAPALAFPRMNNNPNNRKMKVLILNGSPRQGMNFIR